MKGLCQGMTKNIFVTHREKPITCTIYGVKEEADRNPLSVCDKITTKALCLSLPPLLEGGEKGEKGYYKLQGDEV